MPELPVTRWRIVTMPGWPGQLNVLVIVDTVAPAVVDTVERGLREVGLTLVPVPDDE